MAKITTITTSSLKEPDPSGVLAIDKPIGKTPKQLIDKLKSEHPHLKEIPLSYAGRLDPMASGLMLILVGKTANQNRNQYLSLDKRYTFNILWGITTDTYDPLGILTQTKKRSHDTNHGSKEHKINQIIKSFTGDHTLPYPPYSAKPVKGKPLWWWAKQQRLDEIKIPKHQITIKQIAVNNAIKINSDHLINRFIKDIQKVSGDFRQNDILNQWQQFKQTAPHSLLVSKAKIHASSGTYVRQIAHLIGRKFGPGAIAYHIHRTQIGNFIHSKSNK